MTRVRHAADLRALGLLLETASLCARDGVEPKVCVTAVLAAAIELTGASKGNIQVFDESGAVKILVHRGFDVPFLEFFEQVDGATVAAVQSTPLISSKGRVLGTISTHFDAPHQMGERELRFLDLLARQAADLLERVRSEEALVQAADDLRQTLSRAAIGLTRCSRDLRYVTAKLAYARIMNVPLEQILDRPIVEVLSQDAFERLRPYIERVLAGERIEFDVGRCRHLPSRNVHAVNRAWGRDRLGRLRV